MKIILLTSAENDLEEGWHFYEDQEEGVGDYYFNSVMTAIRSLRQDHDIHPQKGGYHSALVRKFHCAIYCTIESESIFIRRVIDQRRDPKWIRSELKSSL